MYDILDTTIKVKSCLYDRKCFKWRDNIPVAAAGC